MNLSWELTGLAMQSFLALCLALWFIARMVKGGDDDPL